MHTINRWAQAMLAMTLAVSSQVAEAQTQETCQALVLSGGGVNGAWESGVLAGLMEYGNPSDYRWDVLTGVSIGGINSSAMSLFEIG